MHIKMPNMITQAISTIIFIIFVYYLNKYNKYYCQMYMSLENLKIKSKYDVLICVIIYFLIYLIGVFLWRLTFISKKINLVIIVNKLKISLITMSYFNIFITLFFYISLMFSIIYIFKLIINIIYKHFLQLHFYIISKESMDVFKKTNYDKIRKIFFYKIYLKITQAPIKFIKTFNLLFNKNYNIKQINKIQYILNRLVNFYALIFLLILFLYDCIFNNFILTKIYYFLPIAFLYNIIISIERFFMQFTKITEFDIACYLYKIKIFEDKNKIIYDNGHELIKENFKSTLGLLGMDITETDTI